MTSLGVEIMLSYHLQIVINQNLTCKSSTPEPGADYAQPPFFLLSDSSILECAVIAPILSNVARDPVASF